MESDHNSSFSFDSSADSRETDPPVGTEQPKPRKTGMIFAVAFLIFDLIGLLVIGILWLNYFSGKNVPKAKDPITAKNWVIYDKDGAYIWTFHDQTCTLYFMTADTDAEIVSDGLEYHTQDDAVTVVMNDSAVRTFYYDNAGDCMWEYDPDEKLRTKVFSCEDFPSEEQLKQNIKGYAYFRYSVGELPSDDQIQTVVSKPQNFNVDDYVYCLINTPLYAEKNLSSDFAGYLTKGEGISIKSIDGDWLGFERYNPWTEESYICWCRADRFSETDVPFVPEYTGKPNLYLFESLIERYHYMRELPISVMEEMMIVNHDDAIPMYDYLYPPRQEVVDSMEQPETIAYTAKGIDTIDDIKNLFRNFLTEKCFDREKLLDIYSGDSDEGFHKINGKYYFHGFIGGRGWNNLIAKDYREVSPTEWIVEVTDYYNRIDYLNYKIVLEDGKYKIDEITEK